MTLNSLMQWVMAHGTYAYLALFLGSYFETLIITSPFVYGEIFFLAGAILAGMGYLDIWKVVLVLYVGGLLGDSSSYWIGKKYGQRFFLFFSRRTIFRKIFTGNNYARGEEYFNKYGGVSIFIARLAGPISWIMPFIAGAFRFSYSQFLKFNIPGVIVGIGQFILLGYLFGKSYQVMAGLLRVYFEIFFAVALLALVGYFYYRRRKNRIS